MNTGRLAVGTVQFGLPYGIANRTGQVPLHEAAAILARARDAGIDTLQTAIGYGDSEQRLGQIGVGHWRVVSKLPGFTGSIDGRSWVRESIAGSLGRLGLGTLAGLMLHRGEDLLGPQGQQIYAGLADLKAAGTIEKIGVSIYDPAELHALLPRFPLDLVQAPFNIVDRRLERSGWLRTLRDRGVEIHVRSAFLQGLLLMTPSERPAQFQRWQSLWNAFDAWVRERDVTQVGACLGFVLSFGEIDKVVIGVDSVSQLTEILENLEPLHSVAPPQLASDDLDLVNPMRWSAS